MVTIPPVSPSALLKDAATAEIFNILERGRLALDAGDNLGAAQAFSQATAVSVVYAVVTAVSLSAAYPIAGLSNALRTLSQSPGIMGKVILKSGLTADPLVVIRLENVAKSFAAGAAAAWLTTKAIDWINSKSIGSIIYDKLNVDPTTNTLFTDARNFILRLDPLVLDLDGDGLELIGASGTVLFDHNADGIKTGTGWAQADDGFLVRDINGNGLIDTGRELFGVDTIKRNNTLATDGFDALRDIDSNSDGVITSLDTAFNELKVWRDLDQNGTTSANELFTLGQLGITRINTAGTPTGPQAGQVINNNQVALSSTFTQNGQTRTVGAIDLEANNFFAQFPAQVVDTTGNPITITAQAQGLPQMKGSGMVRDMRQAMKCGNSFKTREQRNFREETERNCHEADISCCHK
jgi:hypothetical protein